MNIAVFYGGKSCEHNISVITGVQAMRAIEGHHVVPVYMDHSGVFWTGKGFDDINAYRKGSIAGKRVFLKPYDEHLYSDRGKRLCRIDCALICNHGAFGEDGCLQGLLQMCGIAYTGSGVTASAAGMDKTVMKRLFASARLKVVPYESLTRSAFDRDATGEMARIQKPGYPLIVKPASGGSSIGISIAKDEHALINALRVAFMWDNTVVVEHALTDFIELNCAVLGDADSAEASEVEQPVGWKEFLTFQDKYEKGKVKQADGGRLMPADLPEPERLKVRAAAIKAFHAVGASGVARIDFMYTPADKKLFVNEINTIPGSLSNYLFAFGGMSYGTLIDRLIGLAVKERDNRARLSYLYTSNYSLKGK